MTTPDTTATRLRAHDITVGYGKTTILENLSIDIPTGEFTVIVGPNACGKSTLLRALARMLPTGTGSVTLDEVPLASLAPKDVAKQLSLLPQAPHAPDGIIVEDLIARGRYPHQGILRQWSAADREAVDQAMKRANVTDLKDRFVSELSGGQRQRVWIALVLAQQTPIVLLDEPTTYLDITHQVDVLNLARDLQRDGVTVVAVLHELTLAFRYATNLIMMKEGRIVGTGPVTELVTADLIADVYGLDCDLITDPHSGRPIVVPLDRN
ncbi:ABC transporter ATP-binding protein [Corynebacterium pygosceleis]|uniref:ABC transporter ATP-binding protein n=2 Tax=Corynebacterium pygosceleis TaxID=2800406 RepID=A0ABT3WSG0_9CORY|nr:ABC transporter ATP-binding protein [Corynebacterium pygosceleis]MCK7637183.1 ABC transporter ATP-binding protein [Corynebacterium pygosceleis]MCL0120042.1 ABC transporter ATP-binding protein [Corynebacterium pygosceleis]MCX7445086.1 ABC transporter ATP-binding protein [Corynebacterium pygosceleis]